MTDLRSLLDTTVPAFDRADPVGAVRRRVAERRRRRHRLAAGGGALVLGGGAALVALGGLPRAGTTPLPPAGPGTSTESAQPSPTVGPHDGDPRYERLGAFVADHSDVFFGWYLDDADVAVVAWQPDGESAYWRDRLAEVAGTIPYRTKTCPRPSHVPGAGASWADPRTCEAGPASMVDVGTPTPSAS